MFLDTNEYVLPEICWFPGSFVYNFNFLVPPQMPNLGGNDKIHKFSRETRPPESPNDQSHRQPHGYSPRNSEEKHFITYYLR